MAKRDYYEVLGVKSGASEQDMKSAFRRLAKECHPDARPGDKGAEQRFKELNEAYEVLKDPQKRAAYDQFGQAAFETGSTRQQKDAGTWGFGDFYSEPAGFSPGYRASPPPDFSDLLDIIFPGAKEKRSKPKEPEPILDIYKAVQNLEKDSFGTVGQVKAVLDLFNGLPADEKPSAAINMLDLDFDKFSGSFSEAIRLRDRLQQHAKDKYVEKARTYYVKRFNSGRPLDDEVVDNLLLLAKKEPAVLESLNKDLDKRRLGLPIAQTLASEIKAAFPEKPGIVSRLSTIFAGKAP